MDIIYVKKTKENRSCNCCSAQNYRSAFPVMDKYLVDDIYEVHIGCLVPALCGNCLKKLYDAVGDVMNIDRRVHSSDDDADCYCE